MKPYRYAIVVDAARRLECRESIAEYVVHLIAAKYAAGWDTSDIASHLASHLGEQNPASAADFVQSVVDQYAAT